MPGCHEGFADLELKQQKVPLSPLGLGSRERGFSSVVLSWGLPASWAGCGLYPASSLLSLPPLFPCLCVSSPKDRAHAGARPAFA